MTPYDPQKLLGSSAGGRPSENYVRGEPTICLIVAEPLQVNEVDEYANNNASALGNSPDDGSVQRALL